MNKPEVNEKQNKKPYGRRTAAILLMIAGLLFSVWFMQRFMCIPFSYDEIRTINFHKEPENSIDVLLVGSSATYSDFSSACAYEKFGFTSYPYAIGGATSTMWKPAVQDALDTQRPKLVVVDVFGGAYERDLIDTRSNQLSIVYSHTAFSEEKLESIAESCSLVEDTSEESFLFPFIKYHNNVPACIKDLPDRLVLEISGPSPLKGVNTHTRSRWLMPVDPASFTDETAPLDEKNEKIILDFIEYCKSEDLEVLFVKYPMVLSDDYPEELEMNLRANRILEIARENGCGALNMQKHFNDMHLKELRDFYNHGHANTRGQIKITEFLGRYIQDEMGIGPSELSESDKAAWDEAVVWWNASRDMTLEEIRDNKIEDVGDSPALVRRMEALVGSSR